ncbi:DUF5658 family protein [Metabacillus sp. GX 13764]|uniref:DUF5658 family protein n=1 Tax=Metabacillus kandeliae TaxID=2900151 RepID=UPI001E2F9981|nr:DUF5658 family protein [Metabacillus kandeliae]MCD7033172.1 DUF5658 family protein [Metabacillus kandeliae]
MKKWFLYLAAVNFLDAAATACGLMIGAIQEQNPMMSFLYQLHPSVFIGVKCLLSAILVFLAYRHAFSFHRLIKIGAYAAGAVYTFVMALHILWITQSII